MYRLNRLFLILMGIVWGSFGVLIIINPKFYHSELRYYYDFSEIKWPFGIFLIGLGVLFFSLSFRKKSIDAENDYREQERVLMCSVCVKPFQKKEVPTLKCPICNENLEELEGFYERHPEFKKA